MIRLAKAPEPSILTANRAAWEVEFEAARTEGRRLPRRYAEEGIRLALQGETDSKCAYCESRIRHVTTEHVEHIEPKSRRPDLLLEWSNLTIACPKCNQHKADYHSVEVPLLNPYRDDPEEHLEFYGAIVLGKTLRGRVTVQRLELSRAGLLEPKAERIERLESLFCQWEGESDPEVREYLANQVRSEVEGRREFSATARSYLRMRGFDD